MIKPLLILSVIFIASCSPKEVHLDQLVERQDVFFEINSETPFTGTIVNYHENGQLKSRSSVENGKDNGRADRYYENGQLSMTGNFKNGVLDGLEEMYYRNGQLNSVRNFSNGYLDGLSTNYNEIGLLIATEIYREGTRNGSAEYYEDVEMVRDSVRIDTPEFAEYVEFGLLTKGNWQDGVQIGAWHSLEFNHGPVANREHIHNGVWEFYEVNSDEVETQVMCFVRNKTAIVDGSTTCDSVFNQNTSQLIK